MPHSTHSRWPTALRPARFRPHWLRSFSWLALACLLVLPACSKEKMDELVASAKEKTTQLSDATETVKQQVTSATADITDKADAAMEQVKSILPGSGEVKLQTSPPITVTRADLQIIRVDAKRPVILQVTSYPTDRPLETYPCLLLRLLASPSPEPLSGIDSYLDKALVGQLFVQTEANGPIWASPDQETVQVTFESVDSESGLIQGRFAATKLVAPDGKSLTVAGGEIAAKLLPLVDGENNRSDSASSNLMPTTGGSL